MSEPQPPISPATLKRQFDCPHTFDRFIKGLGDTEHRCPFCGESRVSWQTRTTQ